jgi:fumarate hydratase class II
MDTLLQKLLAQRLASAQSPFRGRCRSKARRTAELQWLYDLPIMSTRTESDGFGSIEVPATALWGAQTERSRRYFAIGGQRMPLPVIHAMAEVKRAAALVNLDLGLIDGAKASAIADAAARVAAGEFDNEFPLSVWQTGSGTQSHMNVNEVIANLASRALGGQRPRADDVRRPPPEGVESSGKATLPQETGAARTVHPNDDVNLGQSSNDVFPTAMHVAAALRMRALRAALEELRTALHQKASDFVATLKIGRTHLQDATPVTLGQEFGGYEAQLTLAQGALLHTLPAVRALAIGGTAVGTGLNTHPEFGRRVAAHLSERLGEPFVVAANPFAALAGHEALVALHGALKGLAIALIKIGNDVRLMGSGPRAGLGEIALPENEPGSSIMPGKVNPTQVEALTMVCTQVLGHDVAIGIAASQGQFELNVYKPLIAHDVLDSVQLLTDAMHSFSAHCVAGIVVNEARMRELLDRSLMLVTALTPHIGYDRAAKVAKHAHANALSLRDAALAVGGVSGADFDRWVDPAHMLAPDRKSPKTAG